MEKIVPSSLRIGTVPAKDDVRSIIMEIMFQEKLQLSNDEINALAEYLVYNNYRFFNEKFRYEDMLLVEVYSTNESSAYIRYNYSTSELSLIEDHILTDFTNKEQTIVFKTAKGHNIIYVYDNFNTAAYFDEEASKGITIGPRRELIFDKSPEFTVTDIIDLSDNQDDFHKLATIGNYAYVIKSKKELTERGVTK